jgi:putative transposase
VGFEVIPRRTISFARHQFPPAIIQHAVWLYVRFSLSYRDVEDLLSERGLRSAP